MPARPRKTSRTSLSTDRSHSSAPGPQEGPAPSCVRRPDVHQTHTALPAATERPLSTTVPAGRVVAGGRSPQVVAVTTAAATQAPALAGARGAAPAAAPGTASAPATPPKMATIHCHPADGTRPPAPPGAELDAGKPRTGCASRSGLLEGALQSLLRYPLGCPTPGRAANMQVSTRIGVSTAPSHPSSPLLLSVWEEIIGFQGGPAPSPTSQVRLAADRCSWSRAAKGWS